jgi:hypothetical protein
VFEVSSEDMEKKYYFATQSEKENNMWVKLLQKYVKKNGKHPGKESIVAKKFPFKF